MTRIEYRNVVDRTGWPSGLWDHEPDKVQWQDTATGLPCLAVRHRVHGHWCGYVGVGPAHALYGDHNPEAALHVHGGVNFFARCCPGPEAEEVCHIPGPGESDDVWWLGFDCGHHNDHKPGEAALFAELGIELPALLLLTRGTTYRTLRYVQAECAHLARQLADAR